MSDDQKYDRADSSNFYSDSVEDWSELDKPARQMSGDGATAARWSLANSDQFQTLEEVTKAIKTAGVDDCGLIFGETLVCI